MRFILKALYNFKKYNLEIDLNLNMVDNSFKYEYFIVNLQTCHFCKSSNA